MACVSGAVSAHTTGAQTDDCKKSMLIPTCDNLTGRWEQVMAHRYANPGQVNFASAQGTCTKLLTTSKRRQGAEQCHAPCFEIVRQYSDHVAD